MSTHKRVDAICAAITALAVVLTVLFMNGEALGLTPVKSQDDSGGMFTASDLDGDWDTSSATRITLSGGGAAVSGNGAYVYNGDVYIVYAGRYVLSGELTNGSVIIDAGKTDKIWVALDGVKLHCEDGAAIRVEQADKVFLTLAEGTENTVSSGAQYDADILAAGVDGAIYSRDDLTVNGTGSLTVDAGYRHGIVCNDDLTIAGGSITVNAAQDGIHANDSVRIREADVTIAAGDDGITVSNDDETAFFYMESGSVAIPACYEGLEAVSITIAGGIVDIAPTDDGINASGRGGNSAIRITGGEVTVVNPSGRDADGLDSNGDLYIEGGRVFISVADGGGNCALDYGSESGGTCVISGGTVVACGGSAMAEGFDAGSPQGFLMRSAAAAGGTVVRLADAAGNTLLSEEIPCGFSSVLLSVPGLKVGDVCTLTVGDTQTQVTVDNSAPSGSAQAGMFGGGMRGGRDTGGRFAGQGALDGQPADGQKTGDAQGDVPDMFPGGAGRPDGMGRPDGTQVPDGGELPAFNGEDWAGGQRAPGFGQSQGEGGGMRAPQQGWGGTPAEGSGSASPVSMEAAVLLGISVLALLLGLFVAVRIRH